MNDNAGAPLPGGTHPRHNSPTRSWSSHRKCSNKSRRHKKNYKRGPTVVSSSSFNDGEQNHYTVLGLESIAISADIKKGVDVDQIRAVT
ncbi:hypothetical protein D5086_033128 [Populus alba]|uniref:Uncharacterized protein n=1 Tax=Populus alba TaxID=43335 RepID=A0ACC4AFY3_POPAL